VTRLSIDELRALLTKVQAMTPGPWYAGSHNEWDDEKDAACPFSEAREPNAIDTAPDGLGRTIVSTGGGKYAHDSQALACLVALRNAAEALLTELIERREREAVVRPCQHRFTANPGMYDTSHPYCEICGVAEGCEPPSAARSE